jgi:DNA-binding GntR family transcriptional regulator
MTVADAGPAMSLSDSAYARLRDDIMTGRLRPGVVVSERELAERYSMSKTPVREAIGQVCREGLVQKLPGKGYRIASITIKEILDLFELRLILESAAIEKVIVMRDPSRLVDRLQEQALVTYSLEDEQSHFEFLAANREFHLTIAREAGNARLVQTLDGLLGDMDRLFHLGLVIRDSSEEMAREHQDLLEACRKRNEDDGRQGGPLSDRGIKRSSNGSNNAGNPGVGSGNVLTRISYT